MAASRKKPPRILRERRKSDRDDITKRDWSNNPLGEAFVKKAPETTKPLKFYATEEGGATRLYRQHKILEAKIRRFIKARPIRDMGLTLVKGQRHGYYYVKIKSNRTDSQIFIRIDREPFLNAVRYLEQQGKRRQALS